MTLYNQRDSELNHVIKEDGTLNRIALIKAVRSIYFLSLRDAKALVDNLTDAAERMRPSIIDEANKAEEVLHGFYDKENGLDDVDISGLRNHLANIKRIASIKGV